MGCPGHHASGPFRWSRVRMWDAGSRFRTQSVVALAARTSQPIVLKRDADAARRGAVLPTDPRQTDHSSRRLPRGPLLRDIRQGTRSLMRTPSFTVPFRRFAASLPTFLPVPLI